MFRCRQINLLFERLHGKAQAARETKIGRRTEKMTGLTSLLLQRDKCGSAGRSRDFEQERHRFFDPVGRNENVIVVVARDHIA